LNVLLVAIGAAIGGVARYLIGGWLASLLGADFPWGTVFVNITGAFAIGVVLVLVQGGALPAGARPFVAVGILGGYTTFSTYSYETLELITDSNYGVAVINVFVQLVLGFIGVYLGVVLGRLIGGV
jgi:fluoride exporter